MIEMTAHYRKSLHDVLCRSCRFGHRWSDRLCCSIAPGLVGMCGSVGAGQVVMGRACE